MTKLVLAVSILLLSSAGIEARSIHKYRVQKVISALLIPPPPATEIKHEPEMLTFRDQCALVMYKHLVEQKGSELSPDELAKLSWDYADSMQKLRETH